MFKKKQTLGVKCQPGSKVQLEKDQSIEVSTMTLKQSDHVCGFLDKGTNVTAELEFTGTLRIDGNFQGSISTADNLIIGENGVVHADIKVGQIEIHGHFFGNIEAKNRVEIFPSGRVRGDIRAAVLCVSAGAMLDGGIRMADERPDDCPVSTDMVAEQPNTR